MASDTAQNIIDGALRAAGIIASGETPSTEERNDALKALNQMISSWSSEIVIPDLKTYTITLTGAIEYAVTPRPLKIKAALVRSTAIVNRPLKIATAQEWAAYLDRNGASDHVDLLYYETGYPLAKLHVAPGATAGTLELISDKAIGDGGVFEFRETFTLTGLTSSYTIGGGGTFSTERPVRIKAAALAAASVTDRALELVTADQWARFENKGKDGSWGQVALYKADQTSPTLSIAPAPATGTLHYWAYVALDEFTGLADTIDVPVGYDRALRLNLAVELCPEYGRPVDAALAGIANSAKLSLIGLNKAVIGDPGSQPVDTPSPIVAPPAVPEAA